MGLRWPPLLRHTRVGLHDMLLVLPERDENILLSSRNIQSITVLPSEGVNVYDVLRRKSLVMTKGAVKALVARLEG